MTMKLHQKIFHLLAPYNCQTYNLMYNMSNCWVYLALKFDTCKKRMMLLRFNTIFL